MTGDMKHMREEMQARSPGYCARVPRPAVRCHIVNHVAKYLSASQLCHGAKSPLLLDVPAAHLQLTLCYQIAPAVRADRTLNRIPVLLCCTRTFSNMPQARTVFMTREMQRYQAAAASTASAMLEAKREMQARICALCLLAFLLHKTSWAHFHILLAVLSGRSDTAVAATAMLKQFQAVAPG